MNILIAIVIVLLLCSFMFESKVLSLALGLASVSYLMLSFNRK